MELLSGPIPASYSVVRAEASDTYCPGSTNLKSDMATIIHDINALLRASQGRSMSLEYHTSPTKIEKENTACTGSQISFRSSQLDKIISGIIWNKNGLMICL